jgi:predicted nucleotidyltransferase
MADEVGAKHLPDEMRMILGTKSPIKQRNPLQMLRPLGELTAMENLSMEEQLHRAVPMSESISIQHLRHQIPTLPQSTLAAIRLLYLFGSRACGPAGPLSDYDLAVWLDAEHDTPAFAARLSHELALLLDTERLDLLSLSQAPIELAYAVIAQGKLLFQRDLFTRVEYEADVLSRYGDYLPVLRAQREDTLRGVGYETRVQWYRAALERTERTLGQIRALQGEDQGRV